MAMSLTSTSGCSDCRSAIASGAEPAAVTSASARRRRWLRTSRASGSSSTSSTRSPRSVGGTSPFEGATTAGCGGTVPWAGAVTRGKSTVNVAPRPSPSLSALTLPPCSSTNVPHDRQADPQAAVRAGAGAVRLAESVEDVRQKLGVDARCRCRSPRAATRTGGDRQGRRDPPPAAVNFTALESRFQTTCCSRSGSPWTSGDSTPRSTDEGNLLRLGRRPDGVERPHRRPTATSLRATFSRSLPVVIRDTSSRSSISLAWARALRSMTSTPWRRRPSSLPARATASTRGSHSAACAARGSASRGIHP